MQVYVAFLVLYNTERNWMLFWWFYHCYCADELSGASSQSIKNVIVVLSGKGGVGKSTFAVQLALCLQSKGHKVWNRFKETTLSLLKAS